MAFDPNDWLQALADLKSRGEPCVLVTLADVKGSAPRESGTKLLVTSAGQFGSIGGGHLEHKAAELARGMLRDGAAETRLETLPLSAALGQCCGGKVTLLLEPFLPTGFTVALFGAGHVGKAIASVLAGVPLRLSWIDSREDQFPPDLPANATKIVADHPADEVKDLPAGAYALVMTHSHDLDLAICERLLKRGDLAYVGLIGSASKRRNFEGRLARKGFTEAQIGSLRCPIGLPGIDGKHPREIAIAVAAELLTLHGAAHGQAAGRQAAAETAAAS